jgi:HK97 gp10 family phage protein
MALNIPYDLLPDASPLSLDDYIPALQEPGTEVKATLQTVSDLILNELPDPTGEYDKSYTASVTTNGTSPTGSTNHRYSFEVSNNSRVCHAHFHINWATAGSGISTFNIAFPDDLPDPLLPTGVSGANANIVPCFATLQTALTTETTARGLLKVNSANDGYEIEVVASSGSFRICNVSVTYFIAAAMGINLKIKGLDAAIKNANKIASTARKETQAALNDFGLRVDGTAKQLAPADEGRLRNSIFNQPGNLSMKVGAATIYAAFLEFGTRKYAAQYVASLPADWKSYAATFKGSSGGSFDELLKAIMGWVKRKGIDSDAAYPIALKIIREGIKPKPFLYPAINANLKQLQDDLNNVIK